jgi:hypothetical protein
VWGRVKETEKVTAKHLATDLVLVPERRQAQEAGAGESRRH